MSSILAFCVAQMMMRARLSPFMVSLCLLTTTYWTRGEVQFLYPFPVRLQRCWRRKPDRLPQNYFTLPNKYLEIKVPRNVSGKGCSQLEWVQRQFILCLLVPPLHSDWSRGSFCLASWKSKVNWQIVESENTAGKSIRNLLSPYCWPRLFTLLRNNGRIQLNI